MSTNEQEERDKNKTTRQQDNKNHQTTLTFGPSRTPVSTYLRYRRRRAVSTVDMFTVPFCNAYLEGRDGRGGAPGGSVER